MPAIRFPRWIVLAGALPLSIAAAPRQPWPHVASSRLNLLSRTFGNFSANNVSCGFSTMGTICSDSTGSGTTGGGYWPKGTADEYIFNSGLQVAGLIQGAKSATNPWGGDTSGAFFFDPKGSQKHGAEITKIYDARNPADVANWPELSRVPVGDPAADLFDPALQGRISASEGDLHFVAWEGDSARLSGRPHPLGILAEFRVMGWNYPAGNDDVMYVLITMYNITSTLPTSYSQHRPAMRALLLQKAADFQAANNARFGITLPAGGYTISPFYAAINADPDIGTATNFSSVNLPFAMGYAYQTDFVPPKWWTFDAAKFGPPFFPGPGFVGIKFLNSSNGAPAVQLYTGHSGGSSGLTDARSISELFRYLGGTIGSGGIGHCTGAYVETRDHICFVRHISGFDTRQTQSSIPWTLAPGQSASFALAYIFAAPVALPGFVPTTGVQIDPGEPLLTNHPDSMLAHAGSGGPGVNRIDSITGFLGYTGPTAHNADGSEYQPTIRDFRVVPRSLLGKAQLAQILFDHHFLLPSAPRAPEFFLIPGDKEVTVLWKPSATETEGDGYADFAGSATSGVAGGLTIPNALYDPDYRKFDVEGYRIYRGRTDAAASMRLIAQFDYSNTRFADYAGTVVMGPSAECAPELGVTTACPTLTPVTPGVTSAAHLDYDINGSLVQTRYGDRTLLSTGRTILIRADTAVTGSASGFPALANTGVPFIFVDKAGSCTSCGVSNNLTYYYSVSAFDINSLQSGPSSMESPRVVKSVRAGPSAPNYVAGGGATISGPYGRAGLLTDQVVPTIDPSTGKFDKRQPPTNAATVSLGAVVPQLLKQGTTSVQLDSITFISVADGGENRSIQWYSAGGVVFSVPITINTASYSPSDIATAAFRAIPTDGGLAGVYGGDGGYGIPGQIAVQAPAGYTSGTRGRGCLNGATSSIGTRYFGTSRQCIYGGPRWFIGDAETMNNPSGDNANLFEGIGSPVTLSNAGELAGVSRIFYPLEYFNTASTWRRMSGGFSGFISDADYRVYWGAAGHVDSVIDLTHNTVVPFSTTLAASWGILNPGTVPSTTNDRPGVASFLSVSCVAPFKTDPVIQGSAPCPGGPAIALSQTAVPGPVVICAAATFGCTKFASIAVGPGFVFYLKGEVFVMELAASGLPAAGTAWTMRDYTGGVTGGSGRGGNFGPYAFHPDPLRPFSAPGVSFRFTVDAAPQLLTATAASLARVHTVPDPYYMVGNYDTSPTDKRIAFVNLPVNATVRVYTASARLVRVLHNSSTSFGSAVDWDLKTGEGKWAASGVYFYTVEADGVSRTYRFTIVNFVPK